jgi:hypothetical protein
MYCREGRTILSSPNQTIRANTDGIQYQTSSTVWVVFVALALVLLVVIIGTIYFPKVI